MADSSQYKIKHPLPIEIMIVSLENVTSRSVVIGPEANHKYTVTFLEFGPGQIRLEMPAKLCNVGHTMDFMLKTQNAPINFELHSRGKVSHLVSGEDGFVAVQIELHKYDDKVFQRILKMVDEVQADIDDLFAAVRGVS